MFDKRLGNISALLDFGVDRKTMHPWFSFAALGELLTLRISGLVYMSFSRDWEDAHSEDSSVLEVTCERRRPSKAELAGYGFSVTDTSVLPDLNIIRIEGPMYVKILCRSFDVSTEPLSGRFPEMV